MGTSSGSWFLHVAGRGSLPSSPFGRAGTTPLPARPPVPALAA